MLQDLPNSQGSTRVIDTIIRKLKPQSIDRLIWLLLILFFVILLLAVQNGKRISFWGITIEPSSHDSARSFSPKGPMISASELSMISGKHFDSKLSKDQIIDNIKELVKKLKDIESLESNFYFKLVKLELLIPKYGKYIDTKISVKDTDRKEAYERIQSILQDIGFYKGSIDGDQQSTYNTLRDFQMEYNRRAKKQILSSEDFGIFGYGTLEAIRSTYRLIVKQHES